MISMCNLIEYSDYYLKASKSLWQYYRYETNTTDSESFSFQVRITGSTRNDDNIKGVQIKNH